MTTWLEVLGSTLPTGPPTGGCSRVGVLPPFDFRAGILALETLEADYPLSMNRESVERSIREQLSRPEARKRARSTTSYAAAMKRHFIGPIRDHAAADKVLLFGLDKPDELE